MNDIMVHYGHRHETGSSLCPRCGSNRTQIIGSSHDSTTLIMRCGSCGERTAVAVCAPAQSTGADLVELRELLR